MEHMVRSQNPAVSVIVPAYGVSQFISATLESVRAQTFQDYEILVVNDGSPDTPDLERALQPYLPSIVYIKQPNGGPSAARNTGIRHARGEYVAFLDGDDLWAPEYLQTQMSILREDQSLDLLYCDSWYFGSSLVAGKRYMELFPSQGPVTVKSLLNETCNVITSTVMARREAVIDAGLFNERFSGPEDFDLWVRLALAGRRLHYHYAVLGRRRLRPEGLASNREKMSASLAQVLESHAQDPRLSPEQHSILMSKLAEVRAHYHLEKGKRLIIAGSYKEALASFGALDQCYVSAKLRLATLGLHIAPGLTRFAYRSLRFAAAKWRSVVYGCRNLMVASY